MKSLYSIDPISNELTQYHEGDISVINVVEFLKNQFADHNFTFVQRATVDLRKANILFSAKQVDIIINLFKRIRKVKQGKWALITSTPEQTAIAYYFESLSKEYPLEVKVFSTENAANGWLHGA